MKSVLRGRRGLEVNRRRQGQRVQDHASGEDPDPSRLIVSRREGRQGAVGSSVVSTSCHHNRRPRLLGQTRRFLRQQRAVRELSNSPLHLFVKNK